MKETGKLALSNGCIQLKGIEAVDQVEKKLPTASELRSDAVFKAISAELGEHKEALKGINAVILYEITKNGKTAGKYSG